MTAETPPIPPDEPNRPGKQQLKLDDLIPKKSAVETSIGTLYVRAPTWREWSSLDDKEAPLVGSTAIRLLTNRNPDREDASPLDDRDMVALLPEDLSMLATVLTKRNDWDDLPPDADMTAFGELLIKQKGEETERLRAIFDKMQIGAGYSFLAGDTLKKLQGSLDGLANIRSAASGFREQLDKLPDLGGAAKAWSGLKLPTEVDLGRGIPSDPVRPRTADLIVPRISRPEEMPLGRATLENAANSRETLQKMNALVDVVAGLNETMVKEVLPAWFKKVEDDQKGAKETVAQAARSLWWTKWAVVASVVVTVFATGIQLWVAIEMDRDNGAQQQRVESILREQLAMQQRFLDQQARAIQSASTPSSAKETQPTSTKRR